MRRSLDLAAFVLGALCVGCGGRMPAPSALDKATRINDDMVASRVGRDAYVVSLEAFHHSNVLVVGLPERTVVICSSPYEAEATKALLRWIRRTFAPTRIIAINTHFHADGTGGNDVYRRSGVETYASEQTQQLLRERGQQMRDLTAAGLRGDPARQARVARMLVVPAERTFDAQQGLSFTIGGEDVRVVYPGPAHSPDNVVVHFPSRRLLFGGCMIRADRTIGYTGDADLRYWESAVRSLQSLAADIVVPGHGVVGGPELLQNTIEVVREARAARP